ncbi:hypothetical protein PISL3812_05550 [Talaromyces islandicus]|uniref:Carrier domain-containing protein n=1 Tax=Talaromyces islandicus TaxID=28573 RepID=A0A0U1LYV5_TALIS|nr:hypothetical protein PISL3812_05550 [Talaromyces islandicus]
MYRTGDLVQQNDDGSLTFLGRRDMQIKVRGQRVEVGEIEYWVIQHPIVRDVVVLFPQQGPFQNRLVGIVVLQELASSDGYTSHIQQLDLANFPGLSTQISNLRQHLSRHVMDYMIPTTWIPLAALPRNASSKTDRLQLSRWIASLDPTETQVIAEFSPVDASQAPATALERRLQELWSRVLNLPLSRIALNRSFMALGGDSVTAMEVVSHARREGLQLAIRDVLQTQSISQLAMNVVITGEATLCEDDAPYDPFPLSPIQQLYFDSIASDGLDVQGDNRYNQTVLLRLTQDIDSAELSRALEAVTAKHGMLRARFYHDKTFGWRQRVTPDLSGSFGFRVHRLIGEELDLHNRLAASQTSLNLEYGPVFTADHVQLADRQLLFLAAHHLVVDLVSWRIVLRDLEELLQERTLSIPRSLSFRTWCRLQSDFGKRQVSPANTLPFEVPQPNWDYWGLVPGANLSTDTLSETVSLNTDTTEALFGACNGPLQTEPAEILLAALFQSFHRCFPDRSIPTIFNEDNGRGPWSRGIDLSDTVGWFTTITPVYIPQVGEDIVKTLIWTKECRRRMPGRGLPYFTARYLTKEGQALFAQHDCMEVLVNYGGLYHQAEREDSIFRLEMSSNDTSSAQPLSSVGPKMRQLAVFTIEVSVFAGTTKIDFNFSRHIRHRPAIQGWVKAYPTVLDDLLDRLKVIKPTCTPSNFPIVRLTDNDLTVIQRRYLPDMVNDSLNNVKSRPRPATLPFKHFKPLDNSFSLLETVHLETDTRQDAFPYAPFSSNYIADVLPATDFQALSVAGALSKTQVGVKYYVVNCDGPQELSNLRHSCLKLIEELEVLRTLYVFYGEHMVQVILRSYDPDIQICQTQQDIESFTNEFIQRGMDRPSRFGQPLAHFAIVTRKSTLQHRIILRITHAEYDRTSLPVIVETLRSFLLDRYVHKQPAFSSYVYDLYSRKTQETLRYWTLFLRGSSMPQISSILDPTKQTPLKIRMLPAKTIMTKNISSDGITSAIVVKAAWGLLLARYTNTTDVVFGDTINGRVSASPTVAEAVGCCATLIPARVVIQDHWKVIDLLHRIRDQQLANMEHDSLGFREMIQKCTDWSTSTRCTSAVNLIPHGAFMSSPGDAQYSVSDVLLEDRTSHADITITSVAHSDHLELSLGFAFESIFEDTANILLSLLCETVEEFLSSPQKGLADFSMKSLAGLWQLQNRSPEPHRAPKVIVEQSHKEVPESLLSTVKNTWTLALRERRGRTITPSKPTFSDLGGDIIDAARVVSLLQQQNLHVTVDDVLESSSPLELADLISK